MIERLWLDLLTCGHTRRVETYVDIDRVWLRPGEVTVCFKCESEGRPALVEIESVELLAEGNIDGSVPPETPPPMSV